MMGKSNFWDDLDGQTAIVGGASQGLGLAIASELVTRGANVYLLARGISSLDAAKSVLSPLRRKPTQWIQTHAVDLGDPTKVDEFLGGLPNLPSILFCVAGGAAQEMGFFADLTADQLRACFNKNYFSAAFITQSLMRHWIKDPVSSQPCPRHIILTGSTAALVSLPGYAAYTPTKTALRALADTIRQEALMYPQDIRIHCTFPGTIFTDSFYQEQKSKPALTKVLEGSDNPNDGMTAEAVAHATMNGLRKDEFLITLDFQTKLLLNNMRGPSPPNHGLLDWLIGLLASIVWPFFRASMDRQIKAYSFSSKKLN